MDSLTLARTLHARGVLTKEATDRILATRQQLIKEAIAREAETLFGRMGRGAQAAGGGAMSGLKRVFGRGGMTGGVTATGSPRPAAGHSDVLGNIGKLMAYAGLTAGASAGIHAIGRHSRDKQLRKDIESSYQEMFSEFPRELTTLRERDPHKIQRTFEVLATYAPSLAANPLVAGSFVRQQAGLGVVDSNVIRQLAETQSLIDRAHESRSTLHGKFDTGLGIAQTAMKG